MGEARVVRSPCCAQPVLCAAMEWLGIGTNAFSVHCENLLQLAHNEIV
jgi:hypothetical protein